MSKYPSPLVISYGYECPYHGYHGHQVALASKPKASDVIGFSWCGFQPQDPILETRLYGNLKLDVNRVRQPKTPDQTK